MKIRNLFVFAILTLVFATAPIFTQAQTPWCHTFNSNLSIGASGIEVLYLKIALIKSGFVVSATNSYYDELVASAVSGFQERYRGEVLTPLRLVNPTGYFGPSTRAKMNRLYGCGNTTNPPTPPPTQPPTTPSLTVTSPSTNSNYTVTNGPVIQWTSNIPSGNSITVELLTPTNGAVPSWSNFTTTNDGSESGRLTNSTVASGAYYFRLKTTVNGQTVYGGSGVFQFTGAATIPPPANTLRDFQLRVTDQTTNTGLTGVTVVINRGGGYVATQTTGSDGWTPIISLRVGESHTFSFRKTGYQNISAISLTIPTGSGIYTYGPVSLRAETAPPTATRYTITASASAGGTISPSGAVAVNQGDSQTFVITPSSGYRLANVYVNGTIVGGITAAGYTFSNVQSNQIISATFVPITPTPTPATPSLTVTSPSTNSNWTSTNGPVIQWSFANIPSGNPITVELLTPTNGQVPGWSNFTTANDGSESGRLTNSTVASGAYYFRLKTTVNGQTVYGGSGVFQFTGVATTPPPPPASVCGNGVLDSGEQCDGSNFGGLSCATYNYTTGNLTCSASCTLTTNQCSNPPPPATSSITVSSPTTNYVWIKNATHPVNWTSTNIPMSNNITIELFYPNNVQVPYSQFNNYITANDGNREVSLANVSTGSYYFRLSTTVNGQIIYGGSQVFKVN